MLGQGMFESGDVAPDGGAGGYRGEYGGDGHEQGGGG
jgi:hypothetical protein